MKFLPYKTVITSSTEIFIYTFIIISITQYSVVNAYSQVAINGHSPNNDDGPKIFKALNMDLIYPKTFNSSDNIISTTESLRPFAVSTETPFNKKDDAKEEEEEEEEEKPSHANEEKTVIFVTPRQQDSSENEQEERFVMKEHPSAFVATQPQQQELASTGRAVDYRPAPYNLNYLMKPFYSQRPTRPLQQPFKQRPQQLSNIGKVVYPQSYNGRRPSVGFADRFTPGEAVASTKFVKGQQQLHHNHNHNHHHNDQQMIGGKPSASDVVQSFVPAKDLYSFPPNINAKYPSPSEDPKASIPNGKVTSYLAPPSGILTDNGGYPLPAASGNTNDYTYKEPPIVDYLPPSGPPSSEDDKDAMKDSGPDGSIDNNSDNDDTIGVLPASAMDGDDTKDMDMQNNDPGNIPDHDHDHDHPPMGYDDSKEYPTPPPGWLEDHPEVAHEHHHDHDHDHHLDHYIPNDHFPTLDHITHDYPDIIYDHHHDHHHYEPPPPPPPPPPTTTEEPPTEPPPEPRVKKYSYFYIGRKLWYIPLYFTVWFSFYVLWLIVKSIARHKVNLPNHYVSRRDIPEKLDLSLSTKDYINQLTVKVLQMIDEYHEKLK